MRTEWAGALVATVLANQNRRKDAKPAKLFDFMPHLDEPAISLEEAMATWR